MSEATDIINSRGAKEIETFCRTLAQELEAMLDADAGVWWGHNLDPDHPEHPYHLVLTVTQPFQASPQFWFTGHEVLGYATGETTAAVQDAIRQDLETRFRDF